MKVEYINWGLSFLFIAIGILALKLHDADRVEFQAKSNSGSGELKEYSNDERIAIRWARVQPESYNNSFVILLPSGSCPTTVNEIHEFITVIIDEMDVNAHLIVISDTVNKFKFFKKTRDIHDSFIWSNITTDGSTLLDIKSPIIINILNHEDIKIETIPVNVITSKNYKREVIKEMLL